MVTIAITGGRDYLPTLAELEELLAFIDDRGVQVLRHGDARGVDRIASAFAKARRPDLELDPWPARWKEHGPSRAGPIRNRAMLDGSWSPLFASLNRVDVLVAFDGGKGTIDCRKAACEGGRKIEVRAVQPVSEPRIANRHALPRSLPDRHVYVGRSSPLGNPFDVATYGDRSLELYRRHLWDQIRGGNEDVLEAMTAVTSETTLVCSCWPRPCHAEVIVRAWRSEAVQEFLLDHRQARGTTLVALDAKCRAENLSDHDRYEILRFASMLEAKAPAYNQRLVLGRLPRWSTSGPRNWTADDLGPRAAPTSSRATLPRLGRARVGGRVHRESLLEILGARDHRGPRWSCMAYSRGTHPYDELRHVRRHRPRGDPLGRGTREPLGGEMTKMQIRR
mgnify:CR=1 FL=1